MMKLKSNQTRTYDGEGYKKRAACLCFKSESEEEAGVKGTLGRLVGVFENRDRKHRTYVYVLIVTEVLENWEDSVTIGKFSQKTQGRKREWFKIEDAIKALQFHKPVQASYFESFQQSCLTSNGTPLVAALSGDCNPSYSINQSSVSGIR
ncbi:NUDT3 phosphohydrolase, partial [Polypterus senegalus]